MQDPDPECRHFGIIWHFIGILWHFMAFWHFCQKANCITKSAISAFSCLFLPFRLFHRIRLLDFPALVRNMSVSGLDLIMMMKVSIINIALSSHAYDDSDHSPDYLMIAMITMIIIISPPSPSPRRLLPSPPSLLLSSSSPVLNILAH